MKKVFALVLAVAMVLSLSAVAFAEGASNLTANSKDASDIYGVLDVTTTPYTLEKKALTDVSESSVEYGDTAYFILRTGEATEIANAATDVVTEEKAVSALKVSATWDEGADVIKSVEIVKKTVKITTNEPAVDGTNTAIYLIAVTTTGSDLDSTDVSGKIYLKGKSGVATNKVTVDHYFEVEFTVGYAECETTISSAKSLDADFDGVKTVVNFTDGTGSDDEFVLEFGDYATATVDVRNEKKVLLAGDNDADDDMIDAYPDANLEFVNLVGSFKRTAEVVIYADEGSYLYQVVDGALKAVSAEYDEWEEGFVFKTKTLGSYVISDIELNTSAAVVDTTTANPSTGAAA